MNETELFEYRKKLVDSVMFMKTTLNSLVGTYQILLMTINRFTDYTKVSHEIPLVPTMESIHLIDTLTAPISCVQDLQNRIGIQVEPIDKRISEFVITDRQWLQDNILCLVSNAVKFSMKGTCTIRVFLTDPSGLSDSSSFAASSPPDNLKVVHFEEEKLSYPDVEQGVIYRESAEERKPLLKFIRFEVEDQGIGILKSMQSREGFKISTLTSASEFTKIVFSEPIVASNRTANNAGGSGLGLFCLSKRVEALGGEFGVEEKKGDLLNMTAGTLFWFAIPYTPDNWKVRSFSKRSPSRASSLEGKLSDQSRANCSNPRQGSISNILSVSSDDSKARSSEQGKVLFRENSFTIPRQCPSSVLTADKLEFPLITSARSTPKNSLESVGDRREREKSVKPSRREHVLVVDDSLPIVKMLKLMLEKNGFLVSTASNGLEAVECIRQRSYEDGKVEGAVNRTPPVDTILMDIQMPIMDGIEATSMIRQIEKGIMNEPEKVSASCGISHLIVAMSASSEDGTVNAAYAAGADEFIAKPFNLLSFQRIIEEHHQRRQLSTQGSDPSSSDQGK
jgi:CheY-like chemotaxis protein